MVFAIAQHFQSQRRASGLPYATLPRQQPLNHLWVDTPSGSEALRSCAVKAYCASERNP